nr:MAG: heme-binding protein [Hyphomicrobiales bacterium]
MRTPSFPTLAWIAGAALALSVGPANAQIEQFVVVGEAALRTKEKNEISLDTARRIAEHCEAAARARGAAASIATLNQFGEQVFYLRMDGLRGPRQLEAPIMKARAAIITHEPSSVTNNRIETGDTEKFHQAFYYNIFPTPGGLPIIVDDQFIGDIGVGGSGFDEQCGYDALTAVLGPQPPLDPTVRGN